MNYKAIIFDLDGTLIHTIPGYRYMVVKRTLKDHGKKSTEKDIDRFWFETDRNTLIKETFRLDPDLFWKTYRTHDDVKVRKDFTKTYPDTNYVNNLKRRGFKTGIVTGAPSHIVELEVGLIGTKYFDKIVIAQPSHGFRFKPSTDGLEFCLDYLKVKNHECVFVGNAQEDILMAKRANVLDVLINRNEYAFKDDLDSTIKINTLHELDKILL